MRLSRILPDISPVLSGAGGENILGERRASHQEGVLPQHLREYTPLTIEERLDNDWAMYRILRHRFEEDGNEHASMLCNDIEVLVKKLKEVM